MNEPFPSRASWCLGMLVMGRRQVRMGTERQGYSTRSLGPRRRGAGASASSCLWAPKIQLLLSFGITGTLWDGESLHPQDIRNSPQRLLIVPQLQVTVNAFMVPFCAVSLPVPRTMGWKGNFGVASCSALPLIEASL